ncbi:MAG: GNAT family N-acetyltransferase [Proteobacteria bacterium]|nr:GNAT family N-acetyltransferase [Pseudomonadota bacterium]
MGAYITPPELLKVEHNIQDFDCGHEDLNHWLKHRALKNQHADASRTYVVTTQNNVMAYYSLATGGILHASASGKVRRNMPDPLPVMILGRLAVDQRYHNQGMGRGLLRDAALRSIHVASVVGVRALVVHAISEEAKNFYSKFGFKVSPIDPMMLMVTVKELKASFFPLEQETSQIAMG